MGRLAPGTPTNIHPSSALARRIYANTVPDGTFKFPPMTLAAACASGMRHVPLPSEAERCGCWRCSR